MILLIFAVLGLLVGLIAGGRLSNIATFSLHGWGLVVAAFLIKAAGPLATRILPVSVAEIAICLTHYLLVFLFLWKNRQGRLWCIPTAIATLLNFAVVLSNGGRMPVSAYLLELFGLQERAAALAAGEYFAYCLSGDGTRLLLLGDVIPLFVGDFLLGLASVGDLILGVGVALLAFRMVRPARPNTQNSIEP